jgi:hypothetical protein
MKNEEMKKCNKCGQLIKEDLRTTDFYKLLIVWARDNSETKHLSDHIDQIFNIANIKKIPICRETFIFWLDIKFCYAKSEAAIKYKNNILRNFDEVNIYDEDDNFRIPSKKRVVKLANKIIFKH